MYKSRGWRSSPSDKRYQKQALRLVSPEKLAMDDSEMEDDLFLSELLRGKKGLSSSEESTSTGENVNCMEKQQTKVSQSSSSQWEICHISRELWNIAL